METDEPAGPSRGFLLALGGAMILVLILLAAMLVIPLQPKLTVSAPVLAPGVTSIVMPPNAASVNFSPDNVTVVIGVNNTIEWTNQDTIDHTVYSKSVPNGSSTFQSPFLSKGDTFTVTLNVTGTYDYYCSIHPATMRGTIIVKAAATVVIPPGTANSQLNYQPSSFTVVIGVNNTVTFVNQDSVPHTVTADDGSFNSGAIPAGKSWTYTFTSPGTYSFHCIYHSFMKGTVTVKAAP